VEMCGLRQSSMGEFWRCESLLLPRPPS
jgi:hypothetical protein